MNRDQAEQVVREACAAFVGNLAQHQRIQEALTVLLPDTETEP